MVAVPPHPAGHIPLHPLGKEAGVVKGCLGQLPNIEGLADHQKAQLVRELHKALRGHAVSCADGVDPHLLQQLQASAQCSLVESSPQGAQIMVLAHSVQLEPAAVEQQSLRRAEAHFLKTDPLLHSV